MARVRGSVGVDHRPWHVCREAKKWATKMQDCAQLADKVIEDDTWRLVLHHARLALMLGDYVGSAQEASPKWLSEFNALAQIEDKTKRLDEHLVSVPRREGVLDRREQGDHGRGHIESDDVEARPRLFCSFFVFFSRVVC